MSVVTFLSIADQAAGHLRAEILRGRWSGVMPGKHEIASELGINNKTVEAALRQLEKAGLLIPQGAGRKRLINPRRRRFTRALRIAFLFNEAEQDLKVDYFVELHHALTEAGHSVIHALKSLTELDFNPRRVAGLVRQTRADAWIVCAASRGVLEWFAAQSAPAFALFGQRAGLSIASIGPDKPSAMTAATRHLLGQGHRRVVLLCRRVRRVPRPGTSEVAFLNALREGGISVGDYNLPDWEDTNAGFQRCLEALFRVTPPTALIVDEASYFVAVLQYLLRRGMRVPDDVSLLCTDDSPAFAHCEPPVARITWDSRPLVRRIVNWCANISRGKVDTRQTLTPATFVPGGTVGPVPK